MKNLKYIISAGTCLLLTIFLSTSCTDGNDWEVIEANRLFGPTQGDFSLTADDEIAQIEITWKGVKDAQGYVLEISTEPLSNDIALGEAAGSQVFGNDGEKISSPLTVKELLPETNYYARIKAIGSNKESYWVYAEKSVKTTKEQLLEIPTEDAGDITKESIRVSWMEGCNVTALHISSNSASAPYEETFILEEADKEACSFLFEGLSSLTEYTIELLNNNIIRGTIKVTTAQGEMIEVTVDELTHNSATFSWVEAADAYTLIPGENPTADGAEAFPAGSATTFTASNLNSSTTYTFSVIKNGAIVGYVTFETEYEAPANAVQINSGIDFENAITNGSGDVALEIIGDIEVESSTKISENITSLTVFSRGETPARMKVEGIGLNSGVKISKIEFYNLDCTYENTNNGYILNGDSQREIESLIIKKCNIHDIRGVIRLQKSGANSIIGNITISDCILQRIGSYGVVEINVSEATGHFSKITIEKSTINGLGARLMRFSVPGEIAINQCTFYGFTDKNATIDATSCTLSVSNVLMGNVINTTTGYKANGSPQISNSYYTTDCSYTKSLLGEQIELSSVELFTAPSNGDFTVKDTKYKAYGDPRWNK
ncbi:DUF5123 domain-containing protein [Bacteroides acidifaciens]|nr:DUF5123 domain-containing protein [Bacteroides acidifaciens]MBF0728142.1 DUF5123 domain-containing protein [Bacteroides acidifaciens]MBF0834337.1 DUF5123 domain-containing protein [Bacteroides acidifaciens]GFH86741.1 hypothetical protein IMSAGC001_02152 [Bacteroides acidifaciens]